MTVDFGVAAGGRLHLRFGQSRDLVVGERLRYWRSRVEVRRAERQAVTGRSARDAPPAEAVHARDVAAGMLLARYHLLYSRWGVVAGAGWTDVHVRLPTYAVGAVLTLAARTAVALSTSGAAVICAGRTAVTALAAVAASSALATVSLAFAAGAAVAAGPAFAAVTGGARRRDRPVRTDAA